jgi:uncharacterized DUF497 family protein
MVYMCAYTKSWRSSGILVVVYSWRGDDIRLNSARRAEPHEREEYEDQ